MGFAEALYAVACPSVSYRPRCRRCEGNYMDDLSKDETPMSLEDFFFQDFMPSFAVTQSRVMANQFVLVEILAQLAEYQKDSDKYLAQTYDNVIRRLDPATIDEAKRSDGLLVEAIDRCSRTQSCGQGRPRANRMGRAFCPALNLFSPSPRQAYRPRPQGGA